MTTFKYTALAFRQQENAPIQIAFVAHSGEVLSWAGIPRKSDELLTGFQRFRDTDRINREIVPFFQDSHNCSPTAVIVALRQDSGLGRCRLTPPSIASGQVVEATLEIDLDEDALKDDRVFSAAYDYVNPRLAADVGGGEQLADDEEESPEDAEDEEEEEEGAAEMEDVEDIHLGSETLVRMKDLLDDRSNWSKPEFRVAIADYVKPAFLIDGQHRVSAAAKFGEKGLPFMICGLFGPPWEEQVFQFTVVNLKPKRIPPALIASIAGLSLTRSEQDLLQARLIQAGVRMTEVTIMSLVAYDDQSPFAEQIDMAVGGKAVRQELLGYGGMKRIAKVWYRASRTSLAQIARKVFDTNSVSKARQRWKEERVWFQFFAAFWKAVRAHYPEALWRKGEGNRLFVAANLWALQEVLLSEADGQVPSAWHIDDSVEDLASRTHLLIEKLVEVVNATLVYLPGDVWTVEWTRSSQDTDAGRKQLLQLFQRFVSEGKKIGKAWKGWKKDPWFKRDQ